MSYQITRSNHPRDWDEWDVFLRDNSQGIYLQSKSWLKGYESYGFIPSLIIAKNPEGQIVGGLGVVLAKTGPFKVLVCPYGPILHRSDKALFEDLMDAFKQFGIDSGAFISQISFSFLTGENSEPSFNKFFLSQELNQTDLSENGEGIIFKYVTGISAIRAIRLYPEEDESYEKVFAKYKSSCRRNVRKSETFGHSLKIAKSSEEVRKAYTVIESNAQSQGYAVRSWEDFGQTISAMVDNGTCTLACCMQDSEMKGALMVFDVGNKLHYIMGGTVREEVDQKVGHFLHNSMVKYGIEKGYEFYDISMGGSPGVVRFKEGFGGVVLGTNDTRYWIHKPTLFWVYEKMMPWVQKNKKLISRVLSKK